MLQNIRMKIRTNILLHFFIVIITFAAVLIGMQYYFNVKMAKEAIDRSFHETAHQVALQLNERDTLSKEILYQLESYPDIDTASFKKLRMPVIRHFIHTLERYDQMYAIYLGYPNGDFFEVVNMKIDPSLYSHYLAPKTTRWMIIKIYTLPDGKRVREFVYLDKALNMLGSKREPSDYRVNNRPWYSKAVQSYTPVRTAPYRFSNLDREGITYAKKLPGTQTVLALDYTLGSIDKMLTSLKIHKTGEIYLYGEHGRLIGASGEKEGQVNRMLQQMLSQKKVDTVALTETKNGTAYYLILIPLGQPMGERSYVGISVTQSEMHAPYIRTIYYALGIAFVLLLIFLLLTHFLSGHIVKPVKALMAENERIKNRDFGAVKPIETNIIEFCELSASQIRMSKSIQHYEKEMESLLDAFIVLIADAIDTKSAYTGAHCKKVPVIAEMLAREAEQCTEGICANFRFETKDAFESFKRAAWLHDCGKITTPEYVVDKATKLETIYNRIHEIRTRFEVLWRDIEIAYYQKILEGEEQADASAWMQQEHNRLLEEFAFIASCNLGSEYMEEDAVARIEKIAQQTWLRHFDDRLGLSDEELGRYPDKTVPLPATAYLLEDRPDHLIARIGFDKETFETAGFKMEVPTHLYNRGERYNLCIRKGTLTEEERFQINEHIVMTIKMLERLPFPDSMKTIPTIAGEHHEKMDGTGYPRRKKKEEMSIPSRILAIADIFEALTASDRPYKKAKTLSEALHIMYKMKKENHIDPDLFDLFIKRKIYLTYAKLHLSEEQIDDVDKASLLH